MSFQRYNGDIDGFIGASSKVVSRKINTIHSINPTEVEIRGAKALSVSFCNMTSRFEHCGFEYDKVSVVRLVSRLERLDLSQGSAWKLLTLECLYIRDSIIAATPQPPDTIPSFKEAEKFPRAYRYSAWLLSRIGIESRNDLPQEDNRESITEVFDRNQEWINAV